MSVMEMNRIHLSTKENTVEHGLRPFTNTKACSLLGISMERHFSYVLQR